MGRLAQLGQQEGRAESTFSHKTHHRAAQIAINQASGYVYKKEEKQAATVTSHEKQQHQVQTPENFRYLKSHVEYLKQLCVKCLKIKKK